MKRKFSIRLAVMAFILASMVTVANAAPRGIVGCRACGSATNVIDNTPSAGKCKEGHEMYYWACNAYPVAHPYVISCVYNHYN